MTERKKIIALDFDGTLIPNAFHFGSLFVATDMDEFVVDTVKRLGEKNDLILLTMRESGSIEYDQALLTLKENGIYDLFVGFNQNPTQHLWAPDSRKVYADLYIDDNGVCVPMTTSPYIMDGGLMDDQEFPIVDWRAMQPWLLEKGFM